MSPASHLCRDSSGKDSAKPTHPQWNQCEHPHRSLSSRRIQSTIKQSVILTLDTSFTMIYLYLAAASHTSAMPLHYNINKNHCRRKLKRRLICAIGGPLNRIQPWERNASKQTYRDRQASRSTLLRKHYRNNKTNDYLEKERMAKLGIFTCDFNPSDQCKSRWNKLSWMSVKAYAMTCR